MNVKFARELLAMFAILMHFALVVDMTVVPDEASEYVLVCGLVVETTWW